MSVISDNLKATLASLDAEVKKIKLLNLALQHPAGPAPYWQPHTISEPPTQALDTYTPVDLTGVDDQLVALVKSIPTLPHEERQCAECQGVDYEDESNAPHPQHFCSESCQGNSILEVCVSCLKLFDPEESSSSMPTSYCSVLCED